MKIQGDHLFQVPREELWEALLDDEVLAGTLPGCERLERVGENELRGTLNVKVGPVKGRFDGTVRLTDLIPPEGYHLAVNGRGPAGFLDGKGRIALAARDGGTLLTYSLDAQVGGRVASVGQRLLDSTAKVITRQALEGLEEQLAGRRRGTGSDTEEAPAPPSHTRFAARVARGLIGELVPRRYRAAVLLAGAAILLVLLLLLFRTFS